MAPAGQRVMFFCNHPLQDNIQHFKCSLGSLLRFEGGELGFLVDEKEMNKAKRAITCAN